MNQDEIDYNVLEKFARSRDDKKDPIKSEYHTFIKIGIILFVIAIFYFVFGFTSPQTPEGIARERNASALWLPVITIIGIGYVIYSAMTDKDDERVLLEPVAREILKFTLYELMNDPTSELQNGQLKIGAFTHVYRITNREIPWYYAYGFTIRSDDFLQTHYIAGVVSTGNELGYVKYIDIKPSKFCMDETPDEVYVPPSKYVMMKELESKVFRRPTS